MVFCGIQYPENFNATREVEKIKTEFKAEHRPKFFDCAHYTDRDGYGNTVVVGYWVLTYK